MIRETKRRGLDAEEKLRMPYRAYWAQNKIRTTSERVGREGESGQRVSKEERARENAVISFGQNKTKKENFVLVTWFFHSKECSFFYNPKIRKKKKSKLV